VYAFIRPESKRNSGDLSLLLGLLWLDDVDAKILYLQIHKSILEIGDMALGENPVTIQGSPAHLTYISLHNQHITVKLLHSFI
jgi:hypothetical protein